MSNVGHIIARDDSPPRVYVTQEIPVNYAEAEKYGAVTFLSSRELNQMSDSLWNRDVFSYMSRAFKDYRPGVDYLVPSGSPVNIGLGFYLAFQKGAVVRVLHWQNRERRYHAYDIDIDQIVTSGEQR